MLLGCCRTLTLPNQPSHRGRSRPLSPWRLVALRRRGLDLTVLAGAFPLRERANIGEESGSSLLGSWSFIVLGLTVACRPRQAGKTEPGTLYPARTVARIPRLQRR